MPDRAMTVTGGEQRPEPLVREALDLFGEYQRTGGRPLLTRAVHVFRAAPARDAPRRPEPPGSRGLRQLN